MNATAATAEQYAERIRLMIWEDVLAGRVPTDLPDFSSLAHHVHAEDYLVRADVPFRELADSGPAVERIITIVDDWIRAHALRLSYGAFSPQDVTLLTQYVRIAGRWQDDVQVLARIAGEWLAGIHSITSVDEYGQQHSRAILALTRDVLDQ